MSINYILIRFLKALLIGLIALVIFSIESRTFYIFPNQQNFTYWNSFGQTYIIKGMYFGIIPPNIMLPLSDSILGSPFSLLIDSNNIIVALDDNSGVKINNKNNIFNRMTNQELKNYKFNQESFWIDSFKNEGENLFLIYKYKSENWKRDYSQNFFTFFNIYMNIPILLFCFISVIFLNIIFQKNYYLECCSGNIIKIIFIDILELIFINLIFWYTILACLKIIISAIWIFTIFYLFINLFKKFINK